MPSGAIFPKGGPAAGLPWRSCSSLAMPSVDPYPRVCLQSFHCLIHAAPACSHVDSCPTDAHAHGLITSRMQCCQSQGLASLFLLHAASFCTAEFAKVSFLGTSLMQAGQLLEHSQHCARLTSATMWVWWGTCQHSAVHLEPPCSICSWAPVSLQVGGLLLVSSLDKKAADASYTLGGIAGHAASCKALLLAGRLQVPERS